MNLQEKEKQKQKSETLPETAACSEIWRTTAAGANRREALMEIGEWRMENETVKKWRRQETEVKMKSRFWNFRVTKH